MGCLAWLLDNGNCFITDIQLSGKTRSVYPVTSTVNIQARLFVFFFFGVRIWSKISLRYNPVLAEKFHITANKQSFQIAIHID